MDVPSISEPQDIELTLSFSKGKAKKEAKLKAIVGSHQENTVQNMADVQAFANQFSGAGTSAEKNFTVKVSVTKGSQTVNLNFIANIVEDQTIAEEFEAKANEFMTFFAKTQDVNAVAFAGIKLAYNRLIEDEEATSGDKTADFHKVLAATLDEPAGLPAIEGKIHLTNFGAEQIGDPYGLTTNSTETISIELRARDNSETPIKLDISFTISTSAPTREQYGYSFMLPKKVFEIGINKITSPFFNFNGANAILTTGEHGVIKAVFDISFSGRDKGFEGEDVAFSKPIGW
ncbi:unnamed protein product [Didymodactylos carnosus]|uniref:Uncharacterized protein n=1 Tax=Didymodactylos carnosus TaxID=1234261 RepID=A0A8S2CRN1_9BILA|nr:unnamed protein product [Didymodactylos carnosus]CAF3523962.1 unnamed protein product [Didymodactylos carnosus]